MRGRDTIPTISRHGSPKLTESQGELPVWGVGEGGSDGPGVQDLKDAGAMRMSQEWDTQGCLALLGEGQRARGLSAGLSLHRPQPEFASSHDSLRLVGIRGGGGRERRVSCAWPLAMAL
jgi:hypothetical protein